MNTVLACMMWWNNNINNNMIITIHIRHPLLLSFILQHHHHHHHHHQLPIHPMPLCYNTSWHFFGLHVRVQSCIRWSVFIPPLFKRFGCALFKQNLSLSLCSRYFGYAFKAKPSLPPSLRTFMQNTKGLELSVHSHVLEICMRIQVTSFLPIVHLQDYYGGYIYMFPWSWDLGVHLNEKVPSIYLHLLGEIRVLNVIRVVDAHSGDVHEILSVNLSKEFTPFGGFKIWVKKQNVKGKSLLLLSTKTRSVVQISGEVSLVLCMPLLLMVTLQVTQVSI